MSLKPRDGGLYHSASSAGGILRYADTIDIWIWRSADCRAAARPDDSDRDRHSARSPSIRHSRSSHRCAGLAEDSPAQRGLAAGTFPGILLGILLLASVHQHLVKGVLAIVIIAFSSYSLVGRKPPELPSDSRIWLLGCGFLAGVLGGAYGMNGPPLVIYGAMRRWSPQHFRATLQGYFLPASVVAMAGYWLAGLWVPAVTHYYLLSLPVALPAIFLGRVANHRLRSDSFLAYVQGGLVCVGVLLLIQAIRKA
jgi:uncharacterized membrane protein YfcA